MMFSAKEAIRRRKSVRTFDGSGITVAEREALLHYMADVANPFGVPVAFRLLDSAAHGLTSPVVVGADLYLCAKVGRQPHYELAYGYSFESVCLYAASLGLGTVMLAASINRPAFEAAMALTGDEVMAVASPVGHAAQKRSVRDTLMRRGLKADDRLAFEKLYFRGDFSAPLTPDQAGDFAQALELTRWAPSATNKQPWRAVVAGDTVHFYEERTMRDTPLGDIQKVDMGIALCHFDLAMQEEGHAGRFVFADPGLTAPERTEYIVSYVKEK